MNSYARLCIILRDHEACFVAFINYGKEMSAALFHSKLWRDYLWVDVVQMVFNDFNHKQALPELTRVPSDVSAELCPPYFRSAEKLKKQFRKLRFEFRYPLDRWQHSGQSDPDRFSEFLSTARGEITANSKRPLLFL